MRYLRLTAFLGLTLLLGVGGCPVNSNPAANFVPEPGPDTGNPSAAADDGDAGIVESASDALVGEFPDCTEHVSGDAWRDEILRLVNVERDRAGLNPVTHDQTLEDQATRYACELIHYDFFAHENPFTGTDLRDRAEEFGYDFMVIGENLAAGQSTPAQAMADWMNSPGHRANILNVDFTELGVGVRSGGSYGTYWVQEFGKPLSP